MAIWQAGKTSVHRLGTLDESAVQIFRHESLTWKSHLERWKIHIVSQSPQSSYGGLMENDSFDDSINKTKVCFNILLFGWCLMILSENFKITLTPTKPPTVTCAVEEKTN